MAHVGDWVACISNINAVDDCFSGLISAVYQCCEGICASVLAYFFRTPSDFDTSNHAFRANHVDSFNWNWIIACQNLSAFQCTVLCEILGLRQEGAEAPFESILFISSLCLLERCQVELDVFTRVMNTR